jgi:ubiquinone/menaquinone biosynthesis C-methylase UbiE
MENSIRFRIFSPLTSFFARQLAHPSGWVGRLVMTRALNRRNRELILETLATLETLPLPDRTRLLDVGFGGGLSLQLARAKGVTKLYGVDRSVAAVEQLKKTSPQWLHGAELTVASGVVEQLPFGDSSFDAILSTNTVYFWPNLSVAFKELYRVMASGGRLAIGFASSEKLRSLGPVTQHGFLFYEIGELIESARQAGFSEVHTVALHGRTTEGSHVLVATR